MPSATPTQTPTASPAEAPGANANGMTEVLAPINSVEVIATDGLPKQYMLAVVSGVCGLADGHEISHEGDTIVVKVVNLMPTGLQCPDGPLLALHKAWIPLGSNLKAGVTYRAAVNDVTETFVVEKGGHVPLNSRFKLGVGERTMIADTALAIRFQEIVLDSRCPPEAHCDYVSEAAEAAANKVTVKISVALEGQDESSFLLSLGDPHTFEGYGISLEDLKPLVLTALHSASAANIGQHRRHGVPVKTLTYADAFGSLV